MNKKIIYAGLVALLLTASLAAFFFRADRDGMTESSPAEAEAGLASPVSAVVEPSGPPGSDENTADAPANEPPPLPVAAKPDTRLESSLGELAVVMRAEGEAAAAAFAADRGLELREGKVTVVLETAEPGAVATAVTAAGGSVQAAWADLLQASVPVDNLSSMAGMAGVEYVREPQRPALFATSEGVADISAPAWQAAGVNGAGVKIAVLDPGFSGYQQRIASGDLPANVITQSFRPDGDITGGGEVHGTGCAEIVHDIAPGAQLYLVNFSTDVELGNAIDYLVSQGVQVVSASWGFFGSYRGDGQGDIDDMTATARQAGIFWANSAGNTARTHWSGAFSDVDSDSWTEFAPGSESNSFTAQAGQRIDVFLSWNKWPVTDQDYDLYLIWDGQPGNPVAASDSWQGGVQAPTEEIHYVVPAGRSGTYKVAISNYAASGDATFKLYTYPLSLQYQTAAGSLGGQPADSPHVMSVGAIAAGTMNLESFSARGPTTDGRVKPDVVAPDRVTTVTYGSQGFWGTSASAPHAAGAGALVKDAYSAYSPAAVQSFLEGRATGLGDAGKDNLYGSGSLNMGAPPDSAPPIVSGALPAGDLFAPPATISASFSDSDSGVNPATATLTLDGSPLAGCTATETQVSCPAPALTAGVHAIGGSVGDNAGNTAAIAGSFNYHCGQPETSAGILQTFWGSYADYQASLLSVSWNFCNNGVNEVVGMSVVGSINSNSVMLADDLPAPVGNIAIGACQPATFKYIVPPGVSSFLSSSYATCNDACGSTYAYPGPYPGA